MHSDERHFEDLRCSLAGLRLRSILEDETFAADGEFIDVVRPQRPAGNFAAELADRECRVLPEPRKLEHDNHQNKGDHDEPEDIRRLASFGLFGRTPTRWSRFTRRFATEATHQQQWRRIVEFALRIQIQRLITAEKSWLPLFCHPKNSKLQIQPGQPAAAFERELQRQSRIKFCLFSADFRSGEIHRNSGSTSQNEAPP